ncbi:acetylglutamate kinase [Ostreibacterium oceani]|uniref:Acetylglutamate kinase n=1 Tax=Ostreibacterium oceani TaxID=2654998 RepID=A0A6N7EXN5_9GAMM|nr:acetylglutamate kinase [Ostreibacterium oceani]MPV86300.1 acetylglutamate kinase [Ostreibacterium oceani]
MSHIKIAVIKFGGNALTAESIQQFSQAIHRITQTNTTLYPVIVHGGGPQIDTLLKALSLDVQFVDGLRYTNQDTLDVAEMVLSGQVNKQLVTGINALGGHAAGLSGKDGPTILAEKRQQNAQGQPIDLGYVGHIKQIQTHLLTTLINARFIPVISPLALGLDGNTYNVNADDAAAAIAKALNATHLVMMSNIPGLMDANQHVIPHINCAQIADLVKQKIIHSGMIPKVYAAMDCLSAVNKVHIMDGRQPAQLAQLLAGEPVGTTITA